MKIKEEDIKHIAELARINLSVKELAQYGEQLGDILDYVGQLNKVDTKNVELTAQVSELSNVWRSDDVLDWDKTEVASALDQGETEEGQIKVKRVL